MQKRTLTIRWVSSIVGVIVCLVQVYHGYWEVAIQPTMQASMQIEHQGYGLTLREYLLEHTVIGLILGVVSGLVMYLLSNLFYRTSAGKADPSPNRPSTP